MSLVFLKGKSSDFHHLCPMSQSGSPPQLSACSSAHRAHLSVLLRQLSQINLPSLLPDTHSVSFSCYPGIQNHYLPGTTSDTVVPVSPSQGQLKRKKDTSDFLLFLCTGFTDCDSLQDHNILPFSILNISSGLKRQKCGAHQSHPSDPKHKLGSGFEGPEAAFFFQVFLILDSLTEVGCS